MDKRIQDKLREHQNFASSIDMTKAVEAHIKANDLNETQLRVLRVLEFRSKIIPGACWIKVETICGVVKKSDATVRRALRKLSELNIIEKVGTIREKSGGKGANVYVIRTTETARDKSIEQSGMTNRYDGDNEVQTQDKTLFAKTKEDLCKDAQSKIHSNNVQKSDSGNGFDKNLDKSFTPESVPRKFVELVGRYFDDAERIYHLYTRCIVASNAVGLDIVNDDMAIKAFKDTVFQYKRRKVRGSFDGYFYGVYYNMAVSEVRRQVMGDEIPSWYLTEEGDIANG